MLSAKEVRDILKENIVEVTFTKADGSERTMICTLMDSFLPSKAETIVVQDYDEGNPVITCWDLEYDAWRSFRLDRLVSLEAEPAE